MQPSLLSHLVDKFGTGPENLATEALAFILNTSQPAQAALCAAVRRTGARLPDGLHFQTQAADEQLARPDLVGIGPNNEISVVIEAKFWAGLTENQPMGYLNPLSKLAPSPGGCLLFIAPEKRSVMLQAELMRRADRPATEAPSTEFSFAIHERVLAVTSWGRLLNEMLASAANGHDAAAVESISQLAALCERMDTTAFLPLQSEELTGSLGRRIVQFTELVDDVVAELVRQGQANIAGFKVINPGSSHGRYMVLRGYGVLLQYSPQLWAKWGDSPLWLSLQDASWAKSRIIGQELMSADIPHRDGPKRHHVPLSLPRQAERDTVLKSLRSQIMRIMESLPLSGTQSGLPNAGEDPAN